MVLGRVTHQGLGLSNGLQLLMEPGLVSRRLFLDELRVLNGIFVRIFLSLFYGLLPLLFSILTFVILYICLQHLEMLTLLETKQRPQLT